MKDKRLASQRDEGEPGRAASRTLREQNFQNRSCGEVRAEEEERKAT